MENQVMGTNEFEYAPRRGNRDTHSTSSKNPNSIKKKRSYSYVNCTRNQSPEKWEMRNLWVDHCQDMISKRDEQLSQIECCEKRKCFQVVDKVSLQAKMNIVLQARIDTMRTVLTKAFWQLSVIILKTVLYARDFCILCLGLAETWCRTSGRMLWKSNKSHTILLCYALKQLSVKRKI